VVDEGAVQALLSVVHKSNLPAARNSALRVLARLAKDRRAAAVVMALEGHKVSWVCSTSCVMMKWQRTGVRLLW